MPSFAAAIVTSLAWNWFSRSSSACSAAGANALKPLAGSVIGVPAMRVISQAKNLTPCERPAIGSS